MKKLMVLAILMAGFAKMAFTQTSQVFTKNNKAIDGYDAVAFFNDNRPVKGIAEFVFNWNNSTWHFSSKQNVDSFKTNPEKYAPQFGGYCAYGCSNGYKAPTQIDTWTIVNNKLYFNYNLKVKESWAKNKDTLIVKANANWAKIKNNE